MKIAIVHDQLLIKGGAERVFWAMAQAFPEADLFTLAYHPENTYSEFKDVTVHTSFMNMIVRTNALFRYLFPINIFAIQTVNLNSYDLVLTSSATVAKYVRVRNGTHMCFCYFPTRAIWHGEKYFNQGFLGRVKQAVIWALRKFDYDAAQRVDYFIAQSETTKAAIQKYYHRDADIIPSPINLDRFMNARDVEKQPHFLIVSRLEIWKVLDFAIEAFNQMGLPLHIIGEGDDGERLKALAGPNIRFLGAVDDDALALEYRKAQAVIFTPELEYGLVPLEANACGTPVIAYGKGGVCETMVPWREQGPDIQPDATAIFFQEQTVESVIEAVSFFQTVSFDRRGLLKNAEKNSEPIFQKRLKDYVRTHFSGERTT